MSSGLPTPRPVDVSVLLPAWNAAATLPAALASIQRQTLQAWECVLIDDGSRDETLAIAVRAAASDHRIRVLARPHQGLVCALNEGLRHCTAPFIARMDADDLMHRRRLERQVAALRAAPDLSAVGCHVRIFPRRHMSARLREYESWLNGMTTPEDVARDAFVECPIAHPTLVMRREMAALGYADHQWPEDYDLILRALTSGRRVGVVPQRLVSWRDRADSMCRTHESYGTERFTACKAHYLAQSVLAGVDEYTLWGYGDTGRSLRRALAVYGKRPTHIVEVKPSRIGQRIHGAPVITADALTSLRGQRVLVSVARAEPRRQIRAALAALQFDEGADFVCCA